MKLLKASFVTAGVVAAASAFADSFETVVPAGTAYWPNYAWTKSSGDSGRSAPEAGDHAVVKMNGGYNDQSSLKGMPQLGRLEIIHYGQKSHSGTFTVNGDFVVKAATVESGGKLVYNNTNSHVTFSSGWAGAGNTSITVNGDLWICDYATNRGDALVNLGGRQSGAHEAGNFLYGLRVGGNLNIVNQNVYIQMRDGVVAEIAGQVRFPEIINGRYGTLVINANNKDDGAGVYSQKVRVGGISSVEASGAVIGTRSGSNLVNSRVREGILEITGEGGVFYGNIKDGVSSADTLGRVSVVMNGGGTQRLVGESSFTGAVTSNAGTLLLTSESGLGEITVNRGGTVGAIQNGINAQKLTINNGGKIEFDLGEYNTSVTLANGIALEDGASLLDAFKFKTIGGQREYLLLKDNSNPNAFDSYNGAEKVYTDTNNVTQMGRFIAQGNSLKVIFPDANPLPDPELPNVGNFEIRPEFANLKVTKGRPFKIFVLNAPAGSSYKLTRTLGRETLQSGRLEEGQNTLTFTINEPGQAELVCNDVFEPDSAGYTANLNRFAFMVSPDELAVTNPRPEDFDAYWAERKAEVEAIDPVLELTQVNQTDKYTLYTYNVKADGSELYGTNYADTSNPRLNLCGIVASGYVAVPRNQGDGPFPAVVTFYGAGSYGADSNDAARYAELGMIGFSMNPHPIKQTEDATLRASLVTQVQSTWYYRDRNINDGDPKKIYFNGMFKRCYQTLRAAMAMRTSNQGVALPQWDGKHLATRGFSQGGAQTIAAAYLCPQVSDMTPWCPAMCDLGAAKTGINTGWPGWLSSSAAVREPAVKYFDVATMAQTIHADSYVMAGLIDGTCPPNLVTGAFNSMPAKKKEMAFMQRTGHGITSECNAYALAFIKNSFADSPKQSYSQWAVRNGLWGESSYSHAKSASGSTNLEHYVFGADPRSALKVLTPSGAARSGGNTVLNYQVEEHADGVTITPFWSADLKNWNSSDLTVVDAGSGAYNVEKKGPRPDTMFFKVKIEEN